MNLEAAKLAPQVVTLSVPNREGRTHALQPGSVSVVSLRPALPTALPIDRILAVTALYLWPSGCIGGRRRRRRA